MFRRQQQLCERHDKSNLSVTYTLAMHSRQRHSPVRQQATWQVATANVQSPHTSYSSVRMLYARRARHYTVVNQ